MPRKVQLSPPTAERITTLFRAGESRRKIATVLQEEGYAVPPGGRKLWHHSLVSVCLEQLGLVAPARPPLKPGVLGEGAKRWEAMLRGARASHTPSSRPAAAPEPAELAGPPKPAQSSAPAEPPAQPSAAGQPSDLDETARRWEHALASASTQPAAAPEPAATHSLKIEVDGPCTPADRRLWFSLVRVARAELGQKPSHELPCAHALRLLPIGPPAPGPADLWGAIKRLRASGITWEARLNGRPLSITTPLISGVLTATALTFYFSPELVTLLLDATQFDRLRTAVGREHDPPPSTR